MAKAIIPLATKFNPSKLTFPCLASVKFDGVPLRMQVMVGEDGATSSYTVRTRSGEVNVSCESILFDWFNKNRAFFGYRPGTHYIVGEVTQVDKPYAAFKDTSGIVRRQEDQGFTLKWNVFDYFWDNGAADYKERMGSFSKNTKSTRWVSQVILQTMDNSDELLDTLEYLLKVCPNAEGLIARNYDDEYIPNKRSTGYQKLVKEPMIDLLIVGVEEAVDSKTGAGKGMAGGLLAKYKDTVIGIGPGKLTHKERVDLWERESVVETGLPGKPNAVWNRLWAWDAPAPAMAQIKYKEDTSYDALRQPTFQCWRLDKLEPDA